MVHPSVFNLKVFAAAAIIINNDYFSFTEFNVQTVSPHKG